MMDLPNIWDETKSWKERRKEIIELYEENVFGKIPEKAESYEYSEKVIEKESFCHGIASAKEVIIKAKFKNGDYFEFPVKVFSPNKKEKKLPFFVFVNFFNDTYNRYFPVEEIMEQGICVLMFGYQDITKDNNDFLDGFAKLSHTYKGKEIYNGERIRRNDSGKISMWAWGASAVMDYAETLDFLDFEKAAVIGHSRLGKTALWAGANDERFKYVFSNSSGCMGAAITRGKDGEQLADICFNFPYWFNRNFYDYINRENEMPFDQHFLLSLIAPRKLYIQSSSDDIWADPKAEFLNCIETGKLYEKLGYAGFVNNGELPKVGEVLDKGNVIYHVREGAHFLSRHDWNNYINYIKKGE